MAFKPAAPTTPSPLTDRPSLEEVFGLDLLTQVDRLVRDAVKSTMRSSAYFSENQLTRATLKACQKELPQETLEHVRFREAVETAVRKFPLVQLGHSPMLTTNRMLMMEQRILDLGAEDTQDHVLADAIVQKAIAGKKGISEEQTNAVLAACCTSRNITVIEGTAGAGKSFTMEAVREAYEESGYEVMGTALGWNAAKVLEESAGLKKSVAIAGFVNNLRKAREAGTEFFQGPMLIIVDEAGMVGSEYMYEILESARQSRHKVKVILTGDSKQVAPVDAGAALQMLVEFQGTVRINTIRRQNKKSHRDAVYRFADRKAGQALYTFLHQEALHWCEDKSSMITMVVRDYLSYRLANRANPTKKALVLALSNKDVSELNQRIRAVFRKLGFIHGNERAVRVTDGREQWEAPFAVGDEVVLRTNNKDMLRYHIDENASTTDESQWTPVDVGVFNRNTGKIVGIRSSADPAGSVDFIVDLDNEKNPTRVIINSDRFRHQEKAGMAMVHNFATTIYASQGQTVDQVYLMDSDRMNFRLAYVGMSRHRDDVQIYLNESELHQRLDRMMGRAEPLEARIAAQQGNPMEELPVQIGRYRRSEMLQAVALAWSNDSENLTALLYERRHRLGLLTKESEEGLARLVKGSADDVVIDLALDAEKKEQPGRCALTPPPPRLDIEKILSLPDPVEETEFVRPSEVEENRAATDPHTIPVRGRYNAHAPTPTPASQKVAKPGFSLARMAEWAEHVLLGEKEAGTVNEDAPAEPPLRRPDPTSPFHTQASQTSPVPPEKGLLARGLDALGAALRPDKIDVDALFLPPPPPIGTIDEQGILRFDNVPQTPGAQGGPSDEFLARCRGYYWDTARGNEPRILANDRPGNVAARYRLDGTCTVGEGFPPLLLNAKAAADTPVYLLPGPREWFWMAEHQRKVHPTEPGKIPHMVWAAKDVDWGWMAESLRSRPVRIIRSKVDEGQLKWALDLQKQLAERWGIQAEVVPKPPQTAPTPRRRGP